MTIETGPSSDKAHSVVHVSEVRLESGEAFNRRTRSKIRMPQKANILEQWRLCRRKNGRMAKQVEKGEYADLGSIRESQKRSRVRSEIYIPQSQG